MTEISENHWESIQAKTFTKWVNDKLNKGGYSPISNIYEDFENGVALRNLLEVLLKKSIQITDRPFSRIQKVENLEVLLKNVKRAGVVLINIGPEDIVDGNRKLILGLVWTLISKLSISDIGTGDLSVRDELLRWCQEVTKKYSNVNIVDLSRSWQDGLGFNAIIHHFRPDLVDYDSLRGSDRHKNLEKAFGLADSHFGISRLLDVEDVADVIRPDEKSMITYLSQYYQKFNRMQSEMNSKNLALNILNKIDWSIQHRNLYEIKAKAFLKRQTLFELNKKELENILKNALEKVKEINLSNSILTQSFVELHTIHSSINSLHKMYNLKPYSPPQDLNLNKMKFNYLNNIEGSSDICRLLTTGDQEEVNEDIKEIVNSVDKENLKEIAESYKASLVKNYNSEIASEDLKDVRAIIKNYLEFLNELLKEETYRENIVKKAKSVYKKIIKEKTIKEKSEALSLNDLKQILNKVGLVVDDSILEMLDTTGGISESAFEDAIKVFMIKNYDALNVKRALKVASGGSNEISLAEFNIELMNLKPKIDINELVKDYIKDE